MNFTYTPIQTDRDRVRFALADTDNTAPKFSDEEILAVIAANDNSWQRAVIALIDNLIMKLNIPDFQADWLRVDASKAREGYLTMRSMLLTQYGLGSVGATAVFTYREDLGYGYPDVPYDPNRDF